MPICVCCLRERTSDELSECLVCSQSVCGLSGCVGKCTCSETPVLKLDELIDNLFSDICSNKHSCKACPRLMFVVRDEHDRAIHLNSTFAYVFSKGCAAVLGSTPFDTYSPETALRCIQHNKQARETGKVMEVIEEINSRHWLMRIIPITHRHTKLTVTAGCDITALTKTRHYNTPTSTNLTTYMITHYSLINIILVVLTAVWLVSDWTPCILDGWSIVGKTIVNG